jgi:hypothetical protein
MSAEHPDTPEPPNPRVGWSIYMLSLAASCLICGVLAPFRLFPFISGGRWFWVAIGFGCVLALVVNLFRPRYETTTGRWRAFYDFLLKQLPPPD